MSSFNRAWTLSFLSIFAIIIIAGTMWASQYFAWFKSGLSSKTTTPEPFTVVEVVSGLNVPWSLLFTSENRFLVAERSGAIRAVINGQLPTNNILYNFSEVSEQGEEGLMSIVADPEYIHNKIIYAAVAYQTPSSTWVKVVSLVDRDSYLELGKTIIDQIPAAKYHAGTALAFGPDKKLYITTGDATDKNQAQNLDSLSGKVLRINPDGTIPTDNPYPNSPVFSYGHRNSQGLAWLNGQLYSSEHGPSLFDGAAGGDEINLISAGKNYGWPLVSHSKTASGTEPALLVLTPAEAPASLLAYTGTALPMYTGNLFFGALKGEGLVRVKIDSKNNSILEVEKLLDKRFGRIRAVAQSPSGLIYFSTSNRDGRGSPASTDDRIFKIQTQ